MKKKIIFIQNQKFLNFHYKKYELDDLKKHFFLEIHDLSSILNKNITNKYNYLNEKKNKSIKTFKNFFIWKKKIIYEHKKHKNNLILIYEDKPISFQELYFYFYFLLKKIFIVDFCFSQLPNFNIYKKNDYKVNLSYKLYRLTTRFKLTINFFIISAINSIKSFLTYFLSPNIIFTNGTILFDKIKKTNNNSEVISMNSWECSKIFKLKKLKKKKINYSVYINSFTPNSTSDAVTYGYKRYEIVNEVFAQLNKFFNSFEKLIKTKVVIAAHPRDEKIKKIPQLGNRLLIKNQTLDLIRNAKFVLTHMSIATSYAIFFNKPIVFVCTKEHYKNKFLIRFSQKFAESLKCLFLNVDGTNQKKFVKNLQKIKNIKVNDKYYSRFKKKFMLSSQYCSMPNSKILINVLKDK